MNDEQASFACEALTKRLVPVSFAPDAPLTQQPCSRRAREQVDGKHYCRLHATMARGEPAWSKGQSRRRTTELERLSARLSALEHVAETARPYAEGHGYLTADHLRALRAAFAGLDAQEPA